MSADLADWRNLFDHLDCLIGSELHVNGFIIRFLGFHMMEQDPGWLVRQHSHQFYELHYVFSGSCDTSIDQTRHCIDTGHFYIIQPHEDQEHVLFRAVDDLVRQSSTLSILNLQIAASTMIKLLLSSLLS